MYSTVQGASRVACIPGSSMLNGEMVKEYPDSCFWVIGVVRKMEISMLTGSGCDAPR